MSFSARFGNIGAFNVQGFPVVLMGRLQPWRPLLRWGAGIGVAGLLAAGSVLARETVDATVPLARLPERAQAVHRAVLSGGPFAYAKDGIVFGNREHLLPHHARGYYHEYTVATPGARDRGARRIVCGGAQPKAPDACFYSDDHYNSFTRIEP